MTHLKFREAKASDISFIYDSFMRSQKNDSSLGRSCRTRIFFKEFPQVIDRILSTAKTLVASTAENEDAIIGYLIFEPECVHYVLVKEQWQRMGVAQELIKRALGENKAFTYTHRTHHIKPILEKYPDLTFNPFNLYKKGA